MKIKRMIGTILAALLIGLNYSPVVQDIVDIPQSMRIFYGQDQVLPYSSLLPLEWKSEDAQVVRFQGTTLADEGVVTDRNGVAVQSNKTGSTKVTVELMGIPVKTIDVEVTPEYTLVPGGIPVGIALHTKGALVVGLTEIADADGNMHNPGKEAGLKTGDIIEAIDGTVVKDAAHLTKLVKDREGAELELTVTRDGASLQLGITPVKDGADGKLRLGLWVRDSSAGIGTLSYYDPNNRTFGALGHAITDADTGMELVVKDGEILEAQIIDVLKGEKGKPGELKGMFAKDQSVIGNIDSNTSFGIFGTTDTRFENALYPDAIPIGSHSTVHTGEATILCTVDEGSPKQYACEIVKVNNQNRADTKSMVVKVTDPALLEKTGGIVQGMSGSPIIQDGRLIGAVTHVFVNDPTRGYGIFIDWMLSQSRNLE